MMLDETENKETLIRSAVEKRTVGIVGGGLIGSSWAIVFWRAGWTVRLFDSDKNALNKAEYFIGKQCDLLTNSSGYSDQPKSQKNIIYTSCVGDAVIGVDYVQECGPEILEVKKDLFQKFEQLVKDTCLLASSTSGIVASKFSESLNCRQRVLVVHPTNPPHLVPLVEIAPAPWTSKETVTGTYDIMKSIGQSPIVVKKEIQGFILNRLQGALINEALRLAEGDYASTDDIDCAVRDGLGLRWSFMGPFETIDLNAPGGLADYAARYGQMYREMSVSQSSEMKWNVNLIQRIHKDRRSMLEETKIEERQAWRDQSLADLIAHKSKLDKQSKKFE